MAEKKRLEDERSEPDSRNRPAKRTKYLTIAELFKDYDGTYEPPADWPTNGNEIAWGEPVGRELDWDESLVSADDLGRIQAEERLFVELDAGVKSAEKSRYSLEEIRKDFGLD